MENTRLVSLQIRPKRHYRNGTEITMNVLKIVKDCGIQGAKISEIARRANLSHYAVLERCQKFMDAELLRSISNRKNHVFIITEKGMLFGQQMEEFLALIESIGIRVCN
jgi:predicted transcriptional regulator